MIPVMIYLFIFIIGLMVGSFLNVCIYRIPLEKTIVKGRSYCPSCEKLIPWYLNVPLLSYLILGGKCKYCKAPISPVYPFVELLNAFLVLFSFLIYGFTLTALFLSILFSILIVVSFIDLRHQIIPDGLVVSLLLLAVVHAVYRIGILNDPWQLYLIGFFAASIPLLILGLIYPDGLGGGDVKYMAAAGLFTGWKLILLALFLGNIVALFYFIVLFLKKKASRGTRIPFGPFLSIGIVLALLFGYKLIEIYLGMILGY